MNDNSDAFIHSGNKCEYKSTFLFGEFFSSDENDYNPDYQANPWTVAHQAQSTCYLVITLVDYREYHPWNHFQRHAAEYKEQIKKVCENPTNEIIITALQVFSKLSDLEFTEDDEKFHLEFSVPMIRTKSQDAARNDINWDSEDEDAAKNLNRSSNGLEENKGSLSSSSNRKSSRNKSSSSSSSSSSTSSSSSSSSSSNRKSSSSNANQVKINRFFLFLSPILQF